MNKIDTKAALADAAKAPLAMLHGDLLFHAATLAAHVRLLVAELDAANAKVAKLKEYVMHRSGCNCARPAEWRKGDACDCGLAAALEETTL